jgi:hypothetical protein
MDSERQATAPVARAVAAFHQNPPDRDDVYHRAGSQSAKMRTACCSARTPRERAKQLINGRRCVTRRTEEVVSLREFVGESGEEAGSRDSAPP